MKTRSISLFTTIVVGGLGAAVGGCNGKPASITLEASQREASPGETIVVAANVQGDYERVDWKLTQSSPKTCAGKLVAEGTSSITAEFHAPPGCAGAKADNTIAVTGFFRGGQQATAQTVVRTTFPQGGPSAPASVEYAPPPLPSGGEPSAVGLPNIVAAFKAAGETYFDFSDAGFKARHEMGSDHIAIQLSAPRRSGFGGTCLEVGGRPFDLTPFKSLTVDAAYQSGGGNLEVKLEQLDSSVHDGQAIVNHVPFPASTSRQTYRASLEAVPQALRRATKRICFSTTAPQLSTPVYALGVRIYGVTFEK